MLTRRILLKFAKPYPGLILLTIILGFSGALFNGISTALIVPVILRIVGQPVDLKGAPGLLKAIMTPFDNVPENYRIAAMAGAIILTIALKNLATYTSTLSSSSLTRRLTADMREAGIDLLLNIDIDYYAKTKVGDLINRLGGEIGRAASYVGNIIKLVILSITISVFICLLLSISWQLTIMAAILLSLVTLVNQFAISRSRKFGKILSEMSKAYSIAVLETLNGIRLVKTTANERKEFNRIKRLIRERELADFKAQMNSNAITPLSEFLGVTSLLIIVLLSKTFFADQISTLSAVLLTYLLILLRLLPLVSQLNSLRSSFASMNASVDSVNDLLRLDDKPFLTNGKIAYNGLQTGINFKSVSFAYPGHDKQVLKDVTLKLPRGTTLALVGGSGAGKSTLADLLPRFYDPTGGCITLDDVDLREFDINSIRKCMGVVSQDTFLFNNSVRNNIAYGKQEATEEEVVAAAKRANAYEFISKLPQQFDTMIGDRGVMLSGGQRQRLAIARALLQNPDILILDEATSALDTVSERLVQGALEELSRDRTTLVIAHRLSTVRKADQIAVLEQGKVVEVGTHEELLQKGGYYSRLYGMQFSNNSETTNRTNQSLLRISHEIRTRLHSMIGVLRLLLDDVTDNNQEHQELIADSYKSAFKIINTLDIFEDSLQQQVHYLSTSLSEDNQNNNTLLEHLKNINEFRIQFNNILVSLRSLTDSTGELEQSEYLLLKESLNVSMNLLDCLENVETGIF
ncbi:ATP-binding cassette domain-containing protein [Anabaena sp. CCY 9910]|uniref:ATP-binding cassette domain-containing protein n=1 Tax=Anabaena sp. CCY 9910 TaxID=3103870 RepID=UPI0039DF3BCC